MNSHKLYNCIVITCLVILVIYNFTEVKNTLAVNVNKTIFNLNSNNSLIDGIDRFEWYRKQWESRKKPDPKDKKPVTNASLFYAYEYEFEISVSITTPRDVTPTGSILYCRYFDEHNDEILPPFESIQYPYYVVNCQKRRGARRISLSTTLNGSYDHPIPLIDRMKKELKYELSKCLLLHGAEPKWLQMTELIEHYKLQGVQHFYVYIHNISVYDSHILNEYARIGELEVHYLLEKYKRADLHWQMVAYRDCTLRTRGESKWTIFADLDERLIMTEYNGTILDFLRKLTDPIYAGIQFRQRWIMKTEPMPEKYEGDAQIEKWLPTRRWHNSTGIGPPGHTVKTVIDTSKVVSMWTHYPRVFYPGYKLYYLKPEEGIIRHYRDQSMGDWGKRWLNELLVYGNMTMTDYPEKYMKQLTENVKKRISEVYSNYNNY